MSLVRAVQPLKLAKYFIGAEEREHTSIGAKPTGESRLLNDDGTTTREVRRTSLAEPPRLADDIAVLRDAELGFRSPDEVLIRPRIARRLAGIDDRPAVAGETLARLGSTPDRQLEDLVTSGRQVDVGTKRLGLH